MGEIREKLKKISEEISNVSDEELNIMGQETHILFQVLKLTMGKEDPVTKDASALLTILTKEYDKRHGGADVADPQETVEAPNTINELLSLGDASVQDVDMVASAVKLTKQLVKAPATFYELMSLG
jgi:hypothetical protein